MLRNKVVDHIPCVVISVLKNIDKLAQNGVDVSFVKINV
jgi:hypothetical protein